ncbi:MAG: type II/IV secretion system protein [Holosporales bacterium]|nr:type II/IV secretion system protein [Holosporales bacterium]
MSFVLFLLENEIIGPDVYDIIENSGYINSQNINEFLLSVTGISEEELTVWKSKYYGLDYIEEKDLANYNHFAPEVNYSKLTESEAIPYRVSDNHVEVAIHNPDDIIAMDRIKKLVPQNTEVIFKIAKKSSITSALKKKLSKNEDCIEVIFYDAIEHMASDIHISPYESASEIKYRIDGELRKIKTIAAQEFQRLCVSTKVLAKLDISETRRPQSGHYQTNNIDFRISTHPTIYGENICIRILNKNKHYIKIENIGFDNEQIKYLKKISQYPHGMIIFCGPTGSGKTTSIYSMLATIDKESKNVMTLEDPIEYKIHGVKQTEFKEGVMSFADGVRSILRQDPDIIFVGEIRDADTAHVAVRASMTGHLVFTTVHANDSIGAIKRFQDFGVSAFLVADNIISIISQRLVKRKNGGRTIISEILKIDPVVNDLIYKNANKEEILSYALKNMHFKTLQEDCKEKMKAGLINSEDAERVLMVP